MLCDWAQRVVGSYAEGQRGRRTLAPSAALRSEAAADASRELRALLKLLGNLTQRELVDFSEGEGRPQDQQPPDIAQVRSSCHQVCWQSHHHPG